MHNKFYKITFVLCSAKSLVGATQASGKHELLCARCPESVSCADMLYGDIFTELMAPISLVNVCPQAVVSREA